MAKKLRILLLGETLVLAGLQTIFDRDASIEVIGYTLPHSEEELREMRPDVIIYDMAALQPGFHYILAQELPGLLLIGIDPDSNRVLMWCERQLTELSTHELVEIIHEQRRLAAIELEERALLE
jgi:hypothetical protein